MTREEAIKIIQMAKSEVEWSYPMDYQVAFDMAIKALEQEPCEDTISREAVKKILASAINAILSMVNDMPSVSTEKTGHWIYICNSEVNGLKIVKCSECGKRTYGSGKYCPNCGCKMGVEE